MGENPYQIIPINLCGGSVARLWSLSRYRFLKQFQVLSGVKSLFR